MNWKFLEKPLGDDMSPFGVSFKREGSSGSIVPIFSTFDTLLNGSFANDRVAAQLEMQKKINDENLEYAREVNAQQQANWTQSFLESKRQYQQNRNWAVEDLANERSYNAPGAIVNRLKGAGINPALYFGHGATPQNVSQMSSTQSGPSSGFSGAPFHAEAADISPFFQAPDSSLMNSIGRSMNAFAQSELLRAQTRKTDADTQISNYNLDFSKRTDAARARFLQEQAKHEGYIGDLARTQLAFEQAVNGQRISQVFNDTRMQNLSMQQMSEQVRNYRLQNEILQIQQAYAPKMAEGQLRQLYANVAQLKAQVGLTMANTTLTYAQKEKVIAEKIGQVLSNGIQAKEFNGWDTARQIANRLMDEQAEQQFLNNYSFPYRFNYEMQGKAGQYFPMPSGQYGAAWLRQHSEKRYRLQY